jgi:uncharacterized protein YceK
MKTAAFAIPLAAGALLGTGCCSISARVGAVAPDAAKFYPGVYPGPKLLIHEWQTPRGVEHNVLVRICAPFDFPLCAALDTALLPFDWPYAASQRRVSEGKEPE